MRLALAQINPTVGDLPGNAARIIAAIDEARTAGADLFVLPELAICGYPPKDLLLEEGFVAACERTLEQIGTGHTAGITAVIGCPMSSDAGITNSAVAYAEGALVARYDKRLLPTYDVFDEDRYFAAGDRAVVIEVAGTRVGLAICEDLWRGQDAGFAGRYASDADPVAELVAAGATVIATPSASPFVLGKGRYQRDIFAQHAQKHGVVVAGVNQVGGNDELVFDGHAAVHAPDGRLIAGGPTFEEAVVVCDVDAGLPAVRDARVETSAEELVFEALTIGVRDYLRKTGFRDVVVGLSGGIDSAVVAAIAVAALGPEHVVGVSMPGKYSSEHSKADAIDLAKRLGIACPTAPIAAPFDGFRDTLDTLFGELDAPALGATLPDLAEENLQSRVRGTMLMAVSNRTGALVLTTGNKSEVAVGYCTLYGDMNGGLAVLSDVTKGMVYRVARWMNANAERAGFACAPIPEGTITKPPSAELAPDQKDSDSLPDYDVLDEIVERRVEGRQSLARITSETRFDAEVVRRVARMIDINEYKRKQYAPGIKVTGVAFGTGRRMPIARGWHPS